MVTRVINVKDDAVHNRFDKAPSQHDGLPKFPKLIFLDTNIVQNLHSFGEFIYDRRFSSEVESKLKGKGSRLADDIKALADFMALGIRTVWPIAVSSGTLQELGATPQSSKRYALTTWGNELARYFASDFGDKQSGEGVSSYSEINHFTFIQRRLLLDMLKVMPQEEDRQLIIDAVECGSDIFLTMDYKTVWCHRNEINQLLGLKVMRPTGLLEYVQPWAALIR